MVFHRRSRYLLSRVLLAFSGIAFLGIVVGNAANLLLMAQEAAKPPSSTPMPDWRIKAGGRLAFEVATVKPDTSDSSPEVNFTLGPGDAYANTGGRFLAKNISLLDYIRFAYRLSDGQIEVLEASAPKWIATERFDIQGKSAIANPTKDQMRLMMQSLLADRFELRVHAETRELAVLALVLVRPGVLGAQLRPHPPADDRCSNVAAVTGRDANDGSAPQIPGVCGGLVNVGVPGAASRVRLGGRKVPLALLAAHLGEMGGFDRPVVDQTGLSGTFDLVLEWGADSAAEPRDEMNRQTYLQEALKDQLGLRLERRKSALDVLLIDTIHQQPTDN
jgi:uncharacterized protein (TIGR03435 family)